MMFIPYHPVVKMPHCDIQVLAGKSYYPRSRSPMWLSYTRGKFYLLLVCSLLVVYYMFGPENSSSSRTPSKVTSTRDRSRRILEDDSDVVFDERWQLYKPLNLSLDMHNPDHALVQKLTKATMEDRTIGCVHSSLMEHLGYSVCIYEDSPDDDEEAISRQIRTGSYSEHQSVVTVITHLLDQEHLGLIDIGANLGLYSLAAARLGRSVVAVEPIQDNQKRIVKAAGINKVSDNIILVPHAVSDTRMALRLKIPKKNPGRSYQTFDKYDCRPDDNHTCSHDVPTMVLDELLPFIPFRHALLKIDTQGHGMEALARARVFFQEMEVPIICVAWHYYRAKWNQGQRERERVQHLIENLMGLNYLPSDYRDIELDAYAWRKWPDYVYWISGTRR